MELVTKSALKDDYGFSDSWIARLGDPDETKQNPHYRTGPKMKLWRRDRVLNFIEASQGAYEKRLEQRARRQKLSTEAMNAKRAETLEWAKTVPIVLDQFPRNPKSEARYYFDGLNQSRGKWWKDPPDSVNDNGIRAMLRHGYSNYHELLAQLFRRVGHAEAYHVIRARVMAAIDARLAQMEQSPGMLPVE